MNSNFMRRYILTAGREGESGFKIGHIDSAYDNALHVSFSVERSDSSTSNEAKVQIWNLSRKNISILEQENCHVELRAGYGDSMTTILVGEVRDAITTMDGADMLTELTVIDGFESTQNTYISLSYNGKVECKDIYEQIAKEMGLPIVYGAGVNFISLPNGFSYIGTAVDGLYKISEYCNHNWTIQNEVIQIYKANRPVKTSYVVLSSETGLINIPKRVRIGSKDSNVYGWEINYLLNGALQINDMVRIRSKIINGDFRIQKVTMNGDSLGNDWSCTAQVLAPDAILGDEE